MSLLFVDELIVALTNYLKVSPELQQEKCVNVKVDRHVEPNVMLKLYLQNDVKSVLLLVQRVNGEAQRFHLTVMGDPVPLSRVEVYEVTVWLLDAPKYRRSKDLILLDKVTEQVCKFFYNNPEFGCEKTVKQMNTTIGQQLRYCNQILVTRTNEDLPDYKT